MKKTRVLAGLISVMMLISCFFGMYGSVTATELSSPDLPSSGVDGADGRAVLFESIEEIMGGPVASAYAYDFDSSFDYRNFTRDGAMTCSDGVTFSDGNGMHLDDGETWNFYAFQDWSPLNGAAPWTEESYLPQAAYFKIKGIVKAELGTPRPNDGKEVVLDFTAKTGTIPTGGGTLSASCNEITYYDEWTEYLVVPKAKWTGGYTLYARGERATEGTWQKVAETSDYGAGGDKLTGVTFTGTNGYIKSVRLLKPAVNEENARPEFADFLWFAEEMDFQPTYGNHRQSKVVYRDGYANFPADATTGTMEYQLENVTVPMDGYVEFRTRSNGVQSLSVSDGEKYASVVFDKDYNNVTGGNGYMADGSNTWRTWRFVRTNAGYSIYCKTDADSGWLPCSINASSTTTTSPGVYLKFSVPTGDRLKPGTGQLDYLRVYGSSGDGDLILTDGKSTKVLNEAMRPSYPDQVYARVKANPDENRTLIYTEHGADGILQKLNTLPVPASTEDFVHSFDFSDQEQMVSKYRVFLWDDLAGAKPAAQKYGAKGNLWLWTDAWSLDGTATKTSNELLLQSSKGTEASAKLSQPVENQYDINWNMQLNSLEGTTSVCVSSEGYVTEFDVTKEGVTYRSGSGQVSFPWKMDLKEHRYRLIGDGGTATLFVDEYYVGKMMNLPVSSDDSFVRFCHQDVAEKTSVVKVTDYDVRGYSSLYLPVEGYFDTFDNGSADGWYCAESDGNKWCSADGYMQVEDHAILSSRPYISKKIPYADEYIFTMRFKIESFGDQSWFVIYMPKGSFVMDIRKVFLPLQTPAGQTGYSDEINIDTTKWYTLRVETYEENTKVRVYLDDIKVLEDAIVPVADGASSAMVAQVLANGGWIDPFTIKIDWFQCSPKNYAIELTGVETEAVYSPGESISVEATAPSGEVVTYLLNGVEIARGTTGTTLTNLPEGNFELKAVCGNAVSKPVAFKVRKAASSDMEHQDDEAMASNYAKEISYNVSGAGAIRYGNGVHLIQMNHNDSGVTYLTDTGEESYPYGTGTFTVITDGAIAEVYRNGQFSFSYFMPLNGEVVQSFEGAVSDGQVSSVKERKTYFTERNLSGKNSYKLAKLPSKYVLEFAADSKDVVQLAINDGFYRDNLSIENGTIYIWDCQRNNSFPQKKKVSLVPAGAEVYYRIETVDGASRLYANGRYLASFRGPNTVGDNTLSVNVTSGAISYLLVGEYSDVYRYLDNFDGSGELASENFWMTQNEMAVSFDTAKGVLSLQSSGENGIAELSAFPGVSELSADVRVNSGDGFWLLANHCVSETYTKAGYNFKTGQFEILDVIAGEVVDSKTASGTLSYGETNRMSVKVEEDVNGEMITLLVNETPVLSKITDFTHRGRIGFMLAGGTATIDGVDYRGDAKLVAGVREHVGLSGITLDAIENPNTGQVYFVNMSGGNVTTDGGKTWTPFKPAVGAGISADGWGGLSQHMVQLQDGSIISASLQPIGGKDEYGQQRTGYRIYKSTDYGMNWSRMSGEDNFTPNIESAAIAEGATVNALKQGYSGRFYFVKQKGSSEDDGGLEVWYSDNGKNWTRSLTEILSKKLGFVIAEGFVIETQKHTRLYFRTDMGTIAYFNSYNNGKTWDLTPRKTPFFSGACCFNMDVDPRDPNILYCGWSYDNVNYYARHQFPRTRWALAKSTDCGDHWEMIGTVHENNSIYHNNSNLSISVTSDYVFMNAYSTDTYGVTGSVSRTISFPKDVQKTSKRFEQLHSEYPGQVKTTKVMPDALAEKAMVIYPSSGAVWIRGELIENVARDNYVSLSCVASFVGAYVDEGADGAEYLRFADRRFTFSKMERKLIDGETFVRVSSFADKFGLFITEENGVQIISENDDWSLRQKNAFRYAVDLFNTQP